MLSMDRATFYKAALRSPPLTPEHAHLRSFEAGGKPFRLRVPPDEAALHDLVRQAHASVVAKLGAQTGADYEAAMRPAVARLLADRPVYWSKIWPAGLALARHLLESAGLCAQRSVLELGAGIGVGAVCAAIAGAFDVVVTDIEPVGLDYALASARDNGVGARVRALAWDWNAPPPDGLRGPFDLVLCGDVIYQDEHAPRLGVLLSTLVKPGGLVVFSDSLERPYKEGHQSVLVAKLLQSGFEQHASHDVAVEVEERSTGGIAAGKHVRVLLYRRPAKAKARR